MLDGWCSYANIQDFLLKWHPTQYYKVNSKSKYNPPKWIFWLFSWAGPQHSRVFYFWGITHHETILRLPNSQVITLTLVFGNSRTLEIARISWRLEGEDEGLKPRITPCIIQYNQSSFGFNRMKPRPLPCLVSVSDINN